VSAAGCASARCVRRAIRFERVLDVVPIDNVAARETAVAFRVHDACAARVSMRAARCVVGERVVLAVGADHVLFPSLAVGRLERVRYSSTYDFAKMERWNTHKSLAAQGFELVEMRRLELLTPYMRSKCSTS